MIAVAIHCGGCGHLLRAEGFAGFRRTFATQALAETAAIHSGWAVLDGAHECPDCKPQTTEG